MDLELVDVPGLVEVTVNPCTIKVANGDTLSSSKPNGRFHQENYECR